MNPGSVGRGRPAKRREPSRRPDGVGRGRPARRRDLDTFLREDPSVPRRRRRLSLETQSSRKVEPVLVAEDSSS